MRKTKKWISTITALCVALFGFSACDFSSFLGEQSPFTESTSSGDSSSSSSSSSSGDGSSSSSGDSSSSGSSSGSGDSSSSSSSSGSGDSSSSSSGDSSSSGEEDIVSGELSIHFLYFDNAISGDCTLIKVGDTEVLIDAGSTRGSVDVIVPYIQTYCTDGILEYVVATHAHEDHIAGFVGEEGTDGVFANFECKTIIDYTGQKTTSQISADYKSWRDKEVNEGATHYTALQCYKEVDGAKRSYDLGENVTLQILYQKYYEQSTSNENNYSVCVLLSQNENHYLFTGDLESGGEQSLVQSNDLPKCLLYKGGHHGSNTSSSAALMKVIQPQIVCVCSCCGDKHNFPHQEFINNVAPYTDKVYITAVRNAQGKGVPLNGNIVVTSNAEGVSVNCSNNDLLFKDSDWFKANRVLPNEWKTKGVGMR